jgi:lipopolysaccharide/colanic/teichoic acid biosynthesis glycosyltransferase
MIQLIRDIKDTKSNGRADTHVRRNGAVVLLDNPITHAWYERRRKPYLSHATFLKFKRAIDIVVSLLFIPLALPILALCAIAIRVDSPGPIYFFQERTGKGGKRFKVYKLRTMVRNAAELREKYMHLNELKPPDFKITNDPRVTRVGKWLRKTSLDELPQIFNVLKGDMTLVGPRPSSYGAHTYDLWHTARFELKPGVTGLAQVCGRSELLLDEKLRYDIAYLRNMCLWLDVRILLRTIAVVFNGRGVK